MEIFSLAVYICFYLKLLACHLVILIFTIVTRE